MSDIVSEQTEQVLRNLSEVLKAAGTGFENVVKTTVFLADMNDFAEMDEVYSRYFSENKPARATVQAARRRRGQSLRERRSSGSSRRPQLPA